VVSACLYEEAETMLQRCATIVGDARVHYWRILETYLASRQRGQRVVEKNNASPTAAPETTTLKVPTPNKTTLNRLFILALCCLYLYLATRTICKAAILCHPIPYWNPGFSSALSASKFKIQVFPFCVRSASGTALSSMTISRLSLH
jgi:hypothetical protein